MDESRVWVIIPALNEEKALPSVLAEVPPLIDGIIVVDNGSHDRTPEVARDNGAVVIHESRRGYGSACLAGIAALPPEATIVAFLDADHADCPEELPSIIAPIIEGRADLVIGSRVLGKRERGALTPQARFGNCLATGMIRVLFRRRYSDLGPMRAISREALASLGMRDRSYGWTVEMQVRACLKKLRSIEVPVSYRKRIGRSKISGTLKGTLLAGYKIITTILILRLGFRR